MIPKAGDTVKINPELLDKHSDMIGGLKIFGLGALKVATVIDFGLNIQIYLEGGCVEIVKPNGHFWSLASHTPPVFIMATESVNISVPRNNDGRTECFWCPGIKTQKRGGGLYDVCPQCGK